MKNVKRFEETLFDIPIFSWEQWDMIDDDTFQFYNVDFPYKSMKQYNGYDCSLDVNGKFEITKLGKEISKDYYETELVWSGFVYEIPEFMEELNKKYKG